jgi:signal transduction histidine kinase
MARLVHEFRSPLNAIAGFAEIMADGRFGPLGNPRYVDYARDIRSAAL